jgi:uncharacterized membrane protein
MVKKRSKSGFNKLEKEEEKIENLQRLELKNISKEDKKLNLLQKEEEKIENLAKKEINELDELKNLEEEIKKDVKQSPLKRITTIDMARGLVGSFFGIVAHFAFVEGVNVAEEFHFTMFRATLLLITALFIGFVFLYATGYREIKDKKVLSIMPIRLLVIFGISIISILSVLALFGFIGPDSTFQNIYKQVAVISLPAIIGAITADLLGKKNE